MLYRRPKKYEEFAFVLDEFSADQVRGLPMVRGGELIVQLVGEEFFTLLEAAVHGKSRPGLRSRIYVGKDAPRNVIRIVRRIGYRLLTSSARAELEPVVYSVVESGEQRFTEFFNTATPVTPRLHAIELIPGIGKKYLRKILEEREAQPFAGFDDVKSRVGVPDPCKAIVKRVLSELESPDTKYYLFVREPYVPEQR